MTEVLPAIQKTLGYRFTDETLLEQALTHRSARGRNNERLEFLGDSILNFVIADILYHRFPDLEEGDLSRLRATLVNKHALAGVGKTLDIGQSLSLGEGELKSGGFRRASIIADALEAVIAAIYLDSDLKTVKQIIANRFETAIAGLPDPADLKDPKTKLQEYLQTRGEARPEYEVIDIKGADHVKEFTVECRISGGDIVAQGEGRSRRAAEQAAADKVLAGLSK